MVIREASYLNKLLSFSICLIKAILFLLFVIVLTIGFFSGKNTPQDNRMDELITLMMIQQLMNSPSDSTNNQVINEKKEEKDRYIDKIKKEVLELLEEE